MDEQIRKARAFRQMHDRSSILVLPNAWDAVTARVFARWDFWLSPPRAEELPGRSVIPTVNERRWRRCSAQPLHCPRGRAAGYRGSGDRFDATPEAVADTVRAAIQAGVVGVNIEDGLHRPGALREIDAAAERIGAAREAAAALGVPLVINARTDTYLLGYGASDAERFDQTVRRATTRGAPRAHQLEGDAFELAREALESGPFRILQQLVADD